MYYTHHITLHTSISVNKKLDYSRYYYARSRLNKHLGAAVKSSKLLSLSDKEKIIAVGFLVGGKLYMAPLYTFGTRHVMVYFKGVEII